MILKANLKNKIPLGLKSNTDCPIILLIWRCYMG